MTTPTKPQPTAPPPAMVDSIIRKAAQIQKAARYLQTHAQDEEESQSAYSIYCRAREIEVLIEQLEGEGEAA